MSKIQFPDPIHSPFYDANGQRWDWNSVAWVRRGLPQGIGDSPDDGQQYGRVNPPNDYTDPQYPVEVPGYWALVSADIWYLGPFSSEPIKDNYGKDLVPGHTYYNTLTFTVYVYDGGEWDAFSGVSEIAVLAEFRWDSLNLTAGVPLEMMPDGDEHGNIPVDAWVEGQVIINVYKDGIRFVEQRTSDGTNIGTWDPISPFPGAGTADLWDWWVVTNGPGTVDGITFETGETIQAITDNPSTTTYANNWVQRAVGSGLDAYDFVVNYDDQEITFSADVVDTERLVVETGTLAASQYIKTTFKNACGWDFVNCGVMDPLDQTKLPVQKTVADYVQEVVEAAALTATTAMIGATFDYAGVTPPPNALECNSQPLNELTYPILFSRIGTIWNTFNGMDAPGTGEFRVPPQSVDGNPIFYGGKGAHTVGSYLENTNKEHSHTANHSHTGNSNPAGGHSHETTWRNAQGKSGTGKTVHDQTQPNDQMRVRTTSVGDHNHTISLNTANVTTSTNGSGSAKPDTAVMLKCIWVDVL